MNWVSAHPSPTQWHPLNAIAVPGIFDAPLNVELVERRFWSKVDRRGPDECWEWQGSTGAGYGQFAAYGRRFGAHRFAYELLVGPIAAGLELDHSCRNPPCVNPAHLEPVTTRENQRRGNGVSGLNARKTHCPQGHPYSDENTYINPHRYSRRCRACKNLRRARMRAEGRRPN